MQLRLTLVLSLLLLSAFNASASIVGSIMIDSVKSATLDDNNNIVLDLNFEFPVACREHVRLTPNLIGGMDFMLMMTLRPHVGTPISRFEPYTRQILGDAYDRYKYMTSYLKRESLAAIKAGGIDGNARNGMPPHLHFYSDVYPTTENKLTYLLLVDDQYACFERHKSDSLTVSKLVYNVHDQIARYIDQGYRSTFIQNYESGKLSIDLIMSYREPGAMDSGSKGFFSFTKTANPAKRVDNSWTKYCVR